MKTATLKITLSLLCTSSLSVSLFAAETLGTVDKIVIHDEYSYQTVVHEDEEEEGFEVANDWRVNGDLRMGYVYYDYSNPPLSPEYDPSINKGHKNSKGFYVIPKVSLNTPTYNGFLAKITAAGVTDFGINDSSYESRTFAFGPSGGSYSILQEAYVEYVNDGHTVVAGAKEIVTPMVDADDWYLLANSFQTVYYRNTVLENITFAGGYIHKMAGVWDSGGDGTKYESMSAASVVSEEHKEHVGDKGMWTGAFQYSDGTHHFQLWDYYAIDLYNIFFTQYDYTSEYKEMSYDAGVRFTDYQDVGSNIFTPIDYHVLSLRFDAQFNDGLTFSTGVAFHSDGPGAQSSLSAWGGSPSFARGMIFSYSEAGDMRNINSYKAELGYNFKKEGLDGLWAGARYTYFDLDPEYSRSSFNGLGQDYQKTYGLRITYNDESGLYFTGTYEYADLDQQDDISGFRLIGGYKF